VTTDDEMNNELIERLRRTLHHEADAIRPHPQSYLARQQGTSPGVRRPRPIWPLAAAAVAAVAAAVALIALNLSGGSGGPRVRVGGTIAPAGNQQTTTVPQPVVAAPTTVPVTTLAPPASAAAVPAEGLPLQTTAGPPPPPPMPAGFQPAAVTFVSPSDGWVLGTAPCAAGSCLSLARTYDAGHTWSPVQAPAAGSVAGVMPVDMSVRFADVRDGWVYVTNPSAGPGSSRLWATHDWGESWHQVQLFAGGTIEGLEAADHLVQLAVPSETDGSIHLEASPVGVDDWTDVHTGVGSGAGPVPSGELVLQGTSGWLLQNDRTVVGGVRSTGAGRWSAWTPPCTKANGSAALAASSSTDLVAVCNEGLWGRPGNLPPGKWSPPYPQWIFRSTDGGASFQAVKPLPAGFSASAVTTSPSPATVVVAGSTGGKAAMLASFDGGLTWQSAYRGSGSADWKDLGFTTTEQGVAVDAGPSGSVLLMTRDSGRSWQPVSF
jgi:hypothetical protein